MKFTETVRQWSNPTHPRRERRNKNISPRQQRRIQKRLRREFSK